MGRWIDANEIHMIHDFDNKENRETDIEMRKKPNFDKYKEGGRGCSKNEKHKKGSKANKKY